MKRFSTAQIFLQLTPDRILDAVESYGYRCSGRVLQLNSMENRVYEVEVECENPKSRFDNFKVVKFYRPGRWNDKQLEEEHEFLSDLERELVNVAVPERNKQGKLISELPKTGMRYAVFPKVGGRLLDELGDKQLKKLGTTIARLHQVGIHKPLEERMTLNAENFGYASLDILKEADSVPEGFRQQYEDIAEELCDIAADLLDGVRMQRIHGDLHAGNILWMDENPLLVDFDDVVTGPVVQDIWLIVPGRDEDAVRRRDIVLQSYEELRDFDNRELDLIEPLRALRIIRFAAWIEQRWDDTTFQATFQRFRSPEFWREQYVALDEIKQIIYRGEIE